MKNATSSGNSTPAACALLIRIATQVSSSGGSIATVNPQPKRDFRRSSRPVDFLRIAITREDDLLLAFEQRVEGVEELFLRALLAGEELDVVDQQRIERAIRLLELVDGVVLQRLHHIADEALECTYAMRASGLRSRMGLPTACIRCVLPRPTPP